MLKKIGNEQTTVSPWLSLTLLSERLCRLDERVILKFDDSGPWVDSTNASLELIEEVKFGMITEFYQLGADTSMIMGLVIFFLGPLNGCGTLTLRLSISDSQPARALYCGVYHSSTFCMFGRAMILSVNRN